MATYFHGNTEIHATSAEGLQTLVLINPTYVQFSDNPPPRPNNLVFHNSAANTLSSAAHLPHVPPNNTQQFVGVPIDPNFHDASALHGLIPGGNYNLYNSIDHASPARETPRAHQGLSLIVSSQQLQPSRMLGSEDMKVSGGSLSFGFGVTNEISGIQGVLLSSKYLKATQKLLDEVVSVKRNEIKCELLNKRNRLNSHGSNKVTGKSSGGESFGGRDHDGKRGPEITTSDRQEMQIKKAKLIRMLDEVELRNKQYHNQMQTVVSSFEQVAGISSAKTYIALALQTISKQFRCLKDAITGQVKAANMNLGEEDCFRGKTKGSRLKYIDHQYQQQRALQQLGMIQHSAWRPQRGLPERSVSVLRAWLFEHFLHPYPNDSDKHMLAKQTGLTRSQVSNWFINARVRLWKPMVEEMYLEEIKGHEKNGTEDKANKSEVNESTTSKSLPHEENSPNQHLPSALSSTSPSAANLQNQSVFSLMGSSTFEGLAQGSPRKQRSTDLMQYPTDVASSNTDIKTGDASNVSMKFCNERQGRDGYSFFGGQTNFIGGFGQYPIGEIGRFEAEPFAPRFSGNGVSLTLGLPKQDLISLSGPHQKVFPSQNIQLGSRVEIGEPNEFGSINATPPDSSITDHQHPESKRFAAQLLPMDFVA